MKDSELRRLAREAFRQMDEGHLSTPQLAAYLEKSMSEPERSSTARHLENCAACRELLGDYRQFLSAPEVNVPRADWWDLRSRISRNRGVSVVPWWTWGALAASILLTLGIGFTYFGGFRGAAPEQLLAQTYSEKRLYEFRLAGAAYAVVSDGERGAGRLSEPLLNLQAQLLKGLKAYPLDPKLLRLQGEAELLNRAPSLAVAALKHADEVDPNNAATLGSLGMAYAVLGENERGDAERRSKYYSDALGFFNRSLELRQSQEVLFNSALVLQRLQLYDRAVTQWTEYLKLDPVGGWSEEAAHHLDQAKTKLKERMPHDQARFAAVKEANNA